MHAATFISGNGNGNKTNLRVEIIENLLNASGDGNSAKINSLRQAIRRNKSDMADNTTKALDVLRQVFQHEMTDEIRQIIDRHLRTTFAPAFENLKRNGHEVSQADIDVLCISILDGAKKPFSALADASLAENTRTCIPSCTVLKSTTPSNYRQKDDITRNAYESDGNESDSSMLSYNSALSGLPSNAFNRSDGRPKKRGRPRKVDVDSGRFGTPIIQGTQPVTMAETLKWNPERIGADTRFVLASRANKILSGGHRNSQIFAKYARFFRYTADEEDKAWLFDRNISTRMSGKVLFVALDDCLEIAQVENATAQARSDLKRYSFVVPERLCKKIKQYMAAPFEKLKARVVGAANVSHPQFMPQQTQISQQPLHHSQPMASFTGFI